MSSIDELIQHMRESAKWTHTLTRNELTLINSGAGRIANRMTAMGMGWDEINEVWDHVIEVAERERVTIKKPSIVDHERLHEYGGDMVAAGAGRTRNWGDKEAEREEASSQRPERWR